MNESRDASPPSLRGSKFGGVFLALIVLAGSALVVVGVVLFARRQDISPADCALLEERKNVAVGHLENSDFKERTAAHMGDLLQADLTFLEVARVLPREPLGPRNLTITRLRRLEKANDPNDKEAAAIDLQTAVEMLLKVDGQSPAAHVLAARAARMLEDIPQAEAQLDHAAQLAATDAAIWFELYELLTETQAATDESLDKKRREALSRAYEAAPDNLFVLWQTTELQAEFKDPQLAATLHRLHDLLATMPGLVDNLQRSLPQPLDAIDKTAAAVEQGDWSLATRRCRTLVNLIKSETWSLSDMRRVRRHVLEYVLHDFTTACDRRLAAESESDAGLNVTLVELPAQEQPPELLALQDFKLADFDLDGRLDLIVLREGAVEVYARAAGGKDWRRIADLAAPAGFQRLLVADLDRDDPEQVGSTAYHERQEAAAAGRLHDSLRTIAEAEPPATIKPQTEIHDGRTAGTRLRTDLDVVVFGPAGLMVVDNVLNLESGTRKLQVVKQPAAFEGLRDVLTAAAVDVYHDGDLDLVVSTAAGLSIWSNRGDMTFVDVTMRSQMPPPDLAATALVSVDWDRDVDLDVIVAGPGGGSAGYLENLRHAQFRWRAFENDFEALRAASSVALLDADGNGSWDLALAGKTGISVLGTDINRSGLVAQRASQSLGTSPRTGLATWDFDNDGRLDFLSWGDNAIDFFRGQPRGEFTAAPLSPSRSPKPIRVCQVGDIDQDGDEDLAVAEPERIVLYANEGGNGNHWLAVEPRAGKVDDQTSSFRANHWGFGSLIEVRAGSTYQRRIVDRQWTHFGLGRHEAADQLRVVWTTGVPQDLMGVDGDVVVFDEQLLSGSCPYAYTFDGERYSFFTDLLWAAPLGLQSADGVLAPSRAWEYLRIPGASLREHEGSYRLQITEELWEAAYFDQVQLIAVDHPADVDVYSNEKVGPAEIAQFKVHTVRQPRRPLAARDQHGRDVLAQVRDRDGVYLKAFDRTLGFGYAEPHYLELDLGALENPRRITLFLTGWIFPSGTSANVGISQDPRLAAPQPPSLWVPDSTGQWREVRPYVGFPGGKTKTIAVDLSDAFLTDDYRLRLATNLQIYWDEAFFTVDEGPAPTRLVPLDLTAADLHYRGFSRRTADRGFGPEHYDYDNVSTPPRWPPMQGRFTRYGPVDELLTATDDRLVVMGSGDELSLAFAAPPAPPPPGWKRDFLLYNVGWDKDADLNTVLGETVEPLPFQAMSGYPYGADEPRPDSPRYLDYLRTYQTRTQDPVEFWNQVSHRPSNEP